MPWSKLNDRSRRMRRSVGGSKTSRDDEAHHSMRSGSKSKKPKAPRATGRGVKVSDKKGGMGSGSGSGSGRKRGKPRIRPARRGRPAF